MTEKNEVCRAIGARMAELRRANGMTIRGFAAAAGVAESYVSKLEAGTNAVAVDTLQKLVASLGARVEILTEQEAAFIDSFRAAGGC